MLAYAYLHGLGSSPASRKGTALRDALAARGVTLHMPDLRRPDLRHLSIRAAWDEFEALDRALGRPRWRMAGSSLGGWMLARWAHATGRVDRAVLIATPRNLRALWDRWLSEESRAAWKERGSMLLPDVHGRMQRIGYSFYEDVVALGSAPAPALACESLFVHGTRDVLVPIEEARAFAEACRARLVEFDDAHELEAHVGDVARLAASFLA